MLKIIKVRMNSDWQKNPIKLGTHKELCDSETV